MIQIDEQLTRNYIRTFLGYGTLESKVWLIGPEQGGGKRASEFRDRVTAWANRGQKEIEDLHSYHSAINLDWTGSIQSTWGPLIRIMLASDGKLAPQNSPSPISSEFERKQVLAFQRDCFGKNPGGDSCILDLIPIASPSTKDWGAKNSDHEWLDTRAKYEQAFLHERTELIQAKIKQYKPQLVVFFGLGRKPEWQKMLDVLGADAFEPSEHPRLSCANSDHTFFALIPHPEGLRPKGKGAKNRCLAEIGRELGRTTHKLGFMLGAPRC
jgi:hypothetical protein